MISRKASGVLRGIGMLIVIASHYAEWMLYAGIQPVHLRTQAIVSTWGPLGVDLFLLASGYGLCKSAEKSREAGGRAITRTFVIRRLKNVLLPYLIIAALINVYSGEWANAAAEGRLGSAVLDWLTASSFWFIRVVLVLYLLFMIAFLFSEKLVRLLLITASVIAYTIFLNRYAHGDFWTLSNAAFLIGIACASFEKDLPQAGSRKSLVYACALAVSLAGLLITWQMMLKNGGSGAPDAYGWELVLGIFFTCAAVFLTALVCDRGGVLLSNPLSRAVGALMGAIGGSSLYIYLLHQVLFWILIYKVYRTEPEPGSFIAAAFVIGLITVVIGIILWKLAGIPARIRKGSGEKAEKNIT